MLKKVPHLKLRWQEGGGWGGPTAAIQFLVFSTVQACELNLHYFNFAILGSEKSEI